MFKYRIVSFHYSNLVNDPTMLSSFNFEIPQMILKPFNGTNAFPKQCPRCHSTELLFSRIEKYKKGSEEEIIIEVAEIHSVYCFTCYEQGPLKHFQNT